MSLGLPQNILWLWFSNFSWVLNTLSGVKKTDISSKKFYVNKTNKLLFKMENKDSRFLISQSSPQVSYGALFLDHEGFTQQGWKPINQRSDNMASMQDLHLLIPVNSAGYPFRVLLSTPENYPIAHARTDPTSLSVNWLLSGVLFSMTDHLRVYCSESTGRGEAACVASLLPGLLSLGLSRHVGPISSHS